MKTKVMLVEDHHIVREGLRKLIDMEENMTVVSEAGSVAEALQNFNLHTDVVLLDIKLPDGDGLDLSRELSKTYPKVKFIALTTYDDPLFIRKAIESGVHGFIPKYATFDEIRSAIGITMRTGRYLYPGLNTEMLMNSSESGLTDVELNILNRVAGGENQKNIAESLFLSISTLRRRLQGICVKLGVGTIEEALAAAVKKGLIE